MPRTVLLLPPSEGKAPGGRRRGRAHVPRSFPALAPARATVIDALRTALDDPARAARLLGVKGAALDAAMAADLGLADGLVRPAGERYTGVLYDGLDAATLPEPAAARFRRETLIVSGLWGLLRPADLIPDYKLAIGASLPGIGGLARWWRMHLRPVLAQQTKGALVWDLLPQAHAAVWAEPDDLPALRVTASFAAAHHRGDRVVRTAVTHWSKALRGALARHLLSEPRVHPTPTAVGDVLGAFRHEQGYVLDTLEGRGVHLHATFLAPPRPGVQ